MKNYLIPNKIGVYGFDDNQSQFVPKNAVLISAVYTPDQFPFLTLSNGNIVFDESNYNKFSYSNTIATYNAAAQNLLDTTAQSWGYDNIISAVSYMTSNSPQYSADGTALSNWRDAVWTKAYTIEAGTLPATVNDFLVQLPAAPARPII